VRGKAFKGFARRLKAMSDVLGTVIGFGLGLATLLGVVLAGAVAVTLLAKLLKLVERSL